MAELIAPGYEAVEENLLDSEKEISSLILDHTKEEYEGALRNAAWDMFHEMSPLREGLLNWYPFEPKSEALEFSDGYGALTGVLCASLRKVTVLEKSDQKAQCIAKRHEECSNLTVIIGDTRFLPTDKKYDYIIVEKAANTRVEMEKLLDAVCPFLKETGRLLFVCENRFGMKYWCGVPDPVRNMPFAGIREDGTGDMLTRNDVLQILEQHPQMIGWNLYYPFPDAKLPQAIYTDKYQPKASVRDRVIPYYTEEQKKSLVCLESEICDDLIANGIFNVFANSFLVECSKHAFESETAFAALSTDRGKEHGFATVITTKDTVQKRVLNSAGKKSLELIYQNGQELIQHDVKCVQQILDESMIEMPFVKGPSLIEYLKQLFLKEPDKVEDVIEQLYQNILRSSEQGNFSECRIRDGMLTEQNVGPILRKAYIDMIPYNCFYNDGELLFYDQEFAQEYYPAKYVLFRALRYTYVYIQEAEKIIPLQYFKNKYNLNQIWQAFEREEACFVEDNRNYDLMTSFYKWAGVSRNEVEENAAKLLHDAPKKKTSYPPLRRIRSDLSIYGKDEQLRRIKQVQLRMLEEFMRVCDENDLSYCLFYGTLLGVVRHKGYVPWDDDLDLAMPRRDYDRLVEIAPLVFRYPYFFQTPENDAECFYGGYGKLRDSSTAGIEERHKDRNCNQGIWLDIFPLDDVLAEETEKEKQFRQIRYYQQLLMKKTYPEKRMLWELKPEEEKLRLLQSRCYSREALCEKLHKTMTEYGSSLSDKVAIMARYQGKQMYSEYDRAAVEFVIPMKFENLTVSIPVGYEACLTVDYGENYSLYPPENERKPHHIAVFDTEKSYIDYIQENR